MGTVKPDELLKLWALEKMPIEMATGHILQNLVNIQTSVESINRTLYNLRTDVDSLITHTGMKLDPYTPGRKEKPFRKPKRLSE